VEIYTSTFNSNNAGAGGAILLLTSAVVKINTSFFISNSCKGQDANSYDGGAIYNAHSTKVEIYNSHFTLNSVYASGGASYVAGTFTAENTTFSNNTARAGGGDGGGAAAGGAVYLAQNASASFTGCSFNADNNKRDNAYFVHNTITRFDSTSNVMFACAKGEDGAPITMLASDLIPPPS
jgi:hypothetical protein